MLTRRDFAMTATLLRSACAPESDGFEAAAAGTWGLEPAKGLDVMAMHRELVRFATLALSSSLLSIPKTIISLSRSAAPPRTWRRLRARGLAAEPRFDAISDAQRIALEPTRPASSTLFQVIPQRQSTRAEYDGKPLSTDDLRLLEQAASGGSVQLVLVTDRRGGATELLCRADARRRLARRHA